MFESKQNMNTFADQNVQVGDIKLGISTKMKINWENISPDVINASICKHSCFYYLRNIIRHILSEEEYKINVHTLWFQDWTNVTFFCMGYLWKRYISCRLFETMQLTWYWFNKNKLRVDYSVSLYTSKALHGHAPPYIVRL